MHEIRTTAADDPDVCQFFTLCKTAERIDIRFEVETLDDPRNTGGTYPPRLGGIGSMRPLPNYFGHLFHVQLVAMSLTHSRMTECCSGSFKQVLSCPICH